VIQNFDEIKRQLSDLSGVINSFKSEAVQLKIIELVLGAAVPPSPDERNESNRELTRHKQRRKRTRIADGSPDEKTSPKKPRAGSGSGAVATLRSVYQKSFFKEPRTIGHILVHCETNLARKIKANEISGTLARMVRNDELTRKKNKDGQYEYRNFQP
jgi:hypothetical protein